MMNFIYGKYHAWQSQPGQYLLSDESKKQLYYFKSIDDLINYLWFNDAKAAAKKLHHQTKGEN